MREYYICGCEESRMERRKNNRLIGQTDRQRETRKHKNRKRQKERQTDRQIERQTDTERDGQTDTIIFVFLLNSNIVILSLDLCCGLQYI